MKPAHRTWLALGLLLAAAVLVVERRAYWRPFTDEARPKAERKSLRRF